MSGALDGIRVLDLSRILAGPWATQLLADLGAEVVKVERPGKGDDTRHWGPPYVTSPSGQHADAAYFHCANRNKYSIAIDISRQSGQQLVRDLAVQADVLVENFKVGDLASYGLDWPVLQALNPRLIYCSITGFGQTGPDAQRAGYDAMIQAMGGLMSITGEAEGEPQKVGVAVADLLCGLYACNGILAALNERHYSGLGQSIDLALLDTQIAALANQAANCVISGQEPPRQGTAHPNIVPYQRFPAVDGYFLLAVGNDQQFQRFCQVARRPDWAADERYQTNALRVQHRELLVQDIESVTRRYTCQWWQRRLNAVSVPCGPILTISQALQQPQVQYRGMQVDLPHEQLGSVPGIANPLRFSRTPVSYRSAAPGLAQDSNRVLERWLKLSSTTIGQLREQGVVH